MRLLVAIAQELSATLAFVLQWRNFGRLRKLVMPKLLKAIGCKLESAITQTSESVKRFRRDNGRVLLQQPA